MQDLLDMAYAAQPEVTADILITLVERGVIKDKKESARLLDDAYQIATAARYSYKRRVLPGTETDSRGGALVRALEAGLDGLSLKSRAIDAMVAIDKQKALDMFTSLPRIEVPAVGCEDRFLYDVSAYFATLGRVLTSSITPIARSKGKHIQLLTQRLSELSSPVQIAPAAEMLYTIPLTPGEFAEVIPSFTAAISRMRAEYLPFDATLLSTSNSLLRLAAKGRENQSGTFGMAAVFRAYVMTNLGGMRCTSTGAPEESKLSAMLKAINDTILPKFDPGAMIASIDPNDVPQQHLATKGGGHPYWRTQVASELLKAFKDLRLVVPDGKSGQLTSEGLSAVSAFEAKLGAWAGTSESADEDYFHQRCMLYEGLIGILPRGGTRDKAIGEYATFLETNSLLRTNTVEWLYHLRGLLSLASDGAAQIRLSQSANSTIRVYSRLKQFVPNK